MADVFISYCHQDRADAERIATFLKLGNVSVWWDRDLAGGELFRDEIANELSRAKVVIVLWSSNSIRSRYVLDEAEVAAGSGSLISVMTELFTPDQLPIGFKAFHSVPTSDLSGLVVALDRRGLSMSFSDMAAITNNLPRRTNNAKPPTELAATDREISDKSAKSIAAPRRGPANLAAAIETINRDRANAPKLENLKMPDRISSARPSHLAWMHGEFTTTQLAVGLGAVICIIFMLAVGSIMGGIAAGGMIALIVFTGLHASGSTNIDRSDNDAPAANSETQTEVQSDTIDV